MSVCVVGYDILKSALHLASLFSSLLVNTKLTEDGVNEAKRQKEREESERETGTDKPEDKQEKRKKVTEREKGSCTWTSSMICPTNLWFDNMSMTMYPCIHVRCGYLV